MVVERGGGGNFVMFDRGRTCVCVCAIPLRPR